MSKCQHCGARVKGSYEALCPACIRGVRTGRLFSKPKLSGGYADDVAENPQYPSPADAGSKNRKPAPIPDLHGRRGPAPPQGPLDKEPAAKKERAPPPRLYAASKEWPEPERVPTGNPMDENYDGYYEDTPTDDGGHNRESIEPELIKRIAFIAGGAAVLIIMSIVVMYLL